MVLNKMKQRYTINFNFFDKTYIRSSHVPLVQVKVSYWEIERERERERERDREREMKYILV